MGKRKRRERARRDDRALAANGTTSRTASVAGAAGGAMFTSARWRRHLMTIAAITVVAVAFAGLIIGQIRPSSRSLTASAEPLRGKQLYDQFCAACHGAAGRGAPGWRYQERAAPPLDSSAHAWHHEDEQLLDMILDKPAPDSLMPAWRGVLTRENALDVVAYIKSLWSPYIRANCQGAKHMSCMSHL